MLDAQLVLFLPQFVLCSLNASCLSGLLYLVSVIMIHSLLECAFILIPTMLLKLREAEVLLFVVVAVLFLYFV